MTVVKDNISIELNTAGSVDVHIRVKFTQDAVNRLNLTQTRSGETITNIDAVDLAGVDLSTYKMKRVFRYAGKNEALLQQAELHLWYDVYFDEKVPTRSAMEAYAGLDEITHVECVPEVRLCDFQKIEEPLEPLASMLKTRAEGDEERVLPFNDPRLPEMWHYDKVGDSGNQLSGAMSGSDIHWF